MACLDLIGYEQDSIAVPFEIHQSSGTLVIDGTRPHSGSKSLHITNLLSGTSQRASKRFTPTAAAGPFWQVGYFNVGTPPSAANTIMRVSNAASGSPILVKLNNNRTLALFDDVGLIGTSALVLDLDKHYLIGALFDSTGGPGAHVARLYVDGVEVVASTTRTFTITTVNQADWGGNMNTEAQTVGEWWWDDGKINDNTGTEDNGLPGPFKLVLALPNGNGDANVGVTRGGTDTGSDFGQVAELTPDDLGTYVDLATASGKIYCTLAIPAVIQSYDLIRMVAVGARIAASGAGTTNWFPSIKSQPGGTEVDGVVVTVATTTFGHNDDTTTTQQFKLYQRVDPQTGGPWTKALLQTVQIVAKTSDGSPATRVSALWAYIEYLEGTPPPTPIVIGSRPLARRAA